ncbi:MAG: hypothetical protein U1F68_09330 [Gammaproteobacteria bacterium]
MSSIATIAQAADAGAWQWHGHGASQFVHDRYDRGWRDERPPRWHRHDWRDHDGRWDDDGWRDHDRWRWRYYHRPWRYRDYRDDYYPPSYYYDYYGCRGFGCFPRPRIGFYLQLP